MKILIDGDSCSKIDDTICIAKEHDIPVHIYKDYDHELNNDYAEIHTVEVGSDSADFAIANNTDVGDIVVTNDTGLASLILAKHGFPVNCIGVIYTHGNIESYSNRRHMIKTSLRKARNKVHKTDIPKNRNKHYSFAESLNYLIEKGEKYDIKKICQKA